MTPTEIRIAIAEFCKWQYYSDDDLVAYQVGECGYESKLVDDLNAMHEAEKMLDKEQAQAYQLHLITVTVTLNKLFPANQAYPIDGYVIHATSQQRSEAFVRTINKWKD